MPGTIGPRLKRAFVWAASAGSRRHAWLLPRAAASDDRLLDLRAPYRLDTEHLVVDLLEPATGTLDVTVLGYAGHFPTVVLGRASGSYAGPCRFGMDCRTGALTLADRPYGRLERELRTNRFCCEFVIRANGAARERTTSHYVARHYDGLGKSYFKGANYVNYDAESAAERAEIMRLLDRWRGKGPLLEIGCATGGLLVELERQLGIKGFGLDLSEWAVGEAAGHLGPDRVSVADIEVDPIPGIIARQAPFATILLFSVLEHLANPQAVLERLTGLSAPGTLLLLQTTNGDSLSHKIFGRDWEGYFDWTHKSVDDINVRTVPSWLESLGWRVEDCRTGMVWDRSAEPTHATLREWFDADARFRRLIAERDLGDLLECVAIKQ